VDTDSEGRILRFGEKLRKGEGLINAGVYVVKSQVLDGIEPARFSFENDVLAKGAGEQRFFAMEAAGYFIDIGIPEDLARAGRDLAAPK
jgi:D-glycero-alpha-D-manno-heptose 1-phosphate guanylyltransferase